MKNLANTLFIFVTLFSCVHKQDSHHSHQGKQDIEQNVVIGDNLSANRYSDIYFSSQPSNTDIQQLKSQGFSVIINLRQGEEGSYKEALEKQTVTKAGLSYLNLPTDSKQPITDEYIDSVTSAVKKYRGTGKILIHCSSGNRVGMWLGGHFYKDHKFSKQDSLSLAKNLGLSNQGAIEKVEAYLGISQ